MLTIFRGRGSPPLSPNPSPRLVYSLSLSSWPLIGALRLTGQNSKLGPYHFFEQSYASGKDIDMLALRLKNAPLLICEPLRIKVDQVQNSDF